MHRFTKAAASAALVALVGGGASIAGAGSTGPTLDLTPSSGEPGTTFTVTSDAPCFADEVQGGVEGLGLSFTATPDDQGAWSETLTVPEQIPGPDGPVTTPPGEYDVFASCALTLEV